MIIHLRQMEEGSLELQGEESADALGLEEVGAEAVGPLRYELTAGLSDGGLWAHGRLQISLRLTCVGCLEPFEISLTVPEFALQTELDGRESVDLTDWVREDILLALPPYPKCDAGPERRCPATFPPVDYAPPGGSTPDENPAWAALDQIKNLTTKKD
jgi:uncharacterized protein